MQCHGYFTNTYDVLVILNGNSCMYIQHKLVTRVSVRVKHILVLPMADQLKCALFKIITENPLYKVH